MIKNVMLSEILKKYNKFWFLGFSFFLLTSIGLAIGLLIITNTNSKTKTVPKTTSEENLQSVQLNFGKKILKYHKQGKENIFLFPHNLKTITTHLKDLEKNKNIYTPEAYQKQKESWERKKKYLRAGITIAHDVKKINTVIERDYLYALVASKLGLNELWMKPTPHNQIEGSEFLKRKEQSQTYAKLFHKFEILITTNTQLGKEEKQNSIHIARQTWSYAVHLSDKSLTEKKLIKRLIIKNDGEAKKVGFQTSKETNKWEIYLLKEKGGATIDDFNLILLIDFENLHVAFKIKSDWKKEFKIQKLPNSQFKNSESAISYKIELDN